MHRSVAVSIILAGSVFLLFVAAPVSGACGKDSFPCDDGQCVRKLDWCDGKESCDDGSDEAYCQERNWFGKSPNKCNEKRHFKCADGLCWPLDARCDGFPDCRDASDEDECGSISKPTDESEKTSVERDRTKVESEETEDEDDEDKSEEDKDESEEEENKSEEDKDNSEEDNEKPKESSEEEKDKSRESSEENGRDEATTTAATPLSTKTSNDYDDYEDEYEDPTEATTAKKPTSMIPSTVSKPLEEGPEISSPETDFYARKMKTNGQKGQSSTQVNVPPTKVYRPPPSVRPSSHPTSRKPAIPYTGPTRPYTPRPYRYIGAQYSGQAQSTYRGRYSGQQPPYPPSGRRSYYSQDNNYVSSQPSANHHQRYRNSNGNNGLADWRNGVTHPPRAYGRQLKAPSRFYFRKDFPEIFGEANYPSVKRGVEWIMGIRNSSGGWGKETPRALVALSLVNNSFLTGGYENDLMQKYFQVHLSVNLLRDEPLSLNRLAMYINALIATCQDPRDFQGWDLTELVRNIILKLNRASRPPVINPLVYLSLCLADRNLTHYEAHHLMTYLVATRDDEATRDMLSLALEAFACHMQKERHNPAQYYSLQKMAWNATSKILRRKKSDGSFGSVYSTALAAQALMSVNETVEWDPEPTFRFLKSHQLRDGSFGDFLATYYALPALGGRSLLHLRNTECNPPRVDRELNPLEILQHPGPKNYIHYSLHLGSPLSTGYTIRVLVPDGINFFDVMRVAAFENDQFKFSYEEVNGKISVYSIADLPNDPEQGLAWRLYVRSPAESGNTPSAQHLYTGDIRQLLPTPDKHFVFWYHA